MKRLVMSFVISSIIALNLGLNANASNNARIIEDSPICAIREDIPHYEAVKDDTFIDEHYEVDLFNSNMRSVYWHVWGGRDTTPQNGVMGAVPLGYSEHKDGNTVLNTYHYTRTYLGVFYQGDSGRRWGYGTVSARGTFCDADVWESTVHYVKYGTESN